jgi:PPOX class probable FMN-dependent enzyme
MDIVRDTGIVREADVVRDEEHLRTLVGGAPAERSVRKQLDHLDDYAREFLATSPFCVLATSDADGNCDATPRGDEPGFALVLDDHTLAVPERPGNKRLDSLRNVLVNPRVGLLFVIPGVTHTLRINGAAQIVADGDFFDDMAVYGKPPKLALLVNVAEVYFHCSKAFVRSRLWQPEAWPVAANMPSLGQIMRTQVGIDEAEAVAVDERGSATNRQQMF